MRTVVAIILSVFWVLGCPQVHADTTIPFEGVVDVHKERAALRVGGGETNTVALDIHRVDAETIAFSLDLRHVALPFADLATVVEGNVSLTGEGPSHREAFGEIHGRYTLVNHQPLRDLYLKFAVRERKLIIYKLWAGSLSANGQVELFGDHLSNLNFDIVSTDLEHVAGFFRNDRAMGAPAISGILTGGFSLKGPIAKSEIKGHLAAYGGCFNVLCYDNILIQMDGVFPHIRIDDSTVTHADGFSFNVAGSIDFSDLTRLATQVRQLKKVPIVEEQGGRREWVFKRLRSNEKGDSVTEMKYLLLKDDRGDTEGVLGFEKKIGF
jgi:hypothetical protein